MASRICCRTICSAVDLRRGAPAAAAAAGASGPAAATLEAEEKAVPGREAPVPARGAVLPNRGGQGRGTTGEAHLGRTSEVRALKGLCARGRDGGRRGPGRSDECARAPPPLLGARPSVLRARAPPGPALRRSASCVGGGPRAEPEAVEGRRSSAGRLSLGASRSSAGSSPPAGSGADAACSSGAGEPAPATTAARVLVTCPLRIKTVINVMHNRANARAASVFGRKSLPGTRRRKVRCGGAPTGAAPASVPRHDPRVNLLPDLPAHQLSTNPRTNFQQPPRQLLILYGTRAGARAVPAAGSRGAWRVSPPAACRMPQRRPRPPKPAERK